jgi:hypothetical protein
MLKSDKKLTELNKILANGKYNEINDRISMLRAEEPFEGAIRSLALFYDKTGNEGLKSIITAFFNDVKEISCRAEVIESLKSVNNQASRTMLASSCWQSGLDYSEYAVALADAFMTGDYMTSLECFTVLENCAGTISDKNRAGIIIKLEKKIPGFDTPMQKLARELITMLRG